MSDFIRPLTMTTEEGKPYTRSEAVTQQIKDSLAWTDRELMARFGELLNEVLMYHIHRVRDRNPDIHGALMQDLAERTVRIAKGELRGVDRLGKEEIAMRVEMEILELAMATEPSRKSEFLEVAFTQAVRRRAINLRDQLKGTVEGHRADHKGKTDSIPEFENDRKTKQSVNFAADTRNNPEAALAAFQDEAFHDEAWQIVQAALEREDPRMLPAFRMTVVDGWTLWSAKPEVPTIASHFGLTRRQARYIMERAREIINEVLRAHSADKGDKKMSAKGR